MGEATQKTYLTLLLLDQFTREVLLNDANCFEMHYNIPILTRPEP